MEKIISKRTPRVLHHPNAYSICYLPCKSPPNLYYHIRAIEAPSNGQSIDPALPVLVPSHSQDGSCVRLTPPSTLISPSQGHFVWFNVNIKSNGIGRMLTWIVLHVSKTYPLHLEAVDINMHTHTHVHRYIIDQNMTRCRYFLVTLSTRRPNRFSALHFEVVNGQIILINSTLHWS